MSGVVPGPKGGPEEWARFHETLSEFLHDKDVVHNFTLYCDYAASEDMPGFSQTKSGSPWCRGSCNMLATALTLWINDHERVERWMLAQSIRVGIKLKKWGGHKQYTTYPHTVISYRSDLMGVVYFDSLIMTLDPDAMAREWKCQRLRKVNKAMLKYMNEEFKHTPEEIHVTRLVTYLNSMLGTWPKAKMPFKGKLPWDDLEGVSL